VNAVDTNLAAGVPSFAILAREFVLRFAGAMLQVIATLEIIRVLSPTMAGIYFEGFVLAYGLSAMLRGKYEIYLAHYIVGRSAPEVGISNWTITCALARRTLIRSAIASAALLVLTADLDIQEPQTRPYLETFLPFVLSVPFVTVAMFCAGALRSANRSLGSILISAYAVNLALIGAARLAPDDYSLLVLSWAFFAGSGVAAAIGWGIVRAVFRPGRSRARPRLAAWNEIYAGVSDHAANGLALAALQWGPLCVLALIGPPDQIAEFAVAARTAQVVEIMLPGMLFVPGGLLFQPLWMSGVRRTSLRLLANTAASFAAASAWVAIILVVAPALLVLYGEPYASLSSLLTLLLCVQWVNGTGRPSIRYLAAHWPPNRIRSALVLSALVAILLCVLGAPLYGTYGAAVASLVGALILNGQAVYAAVRVARAAR
jgi:O-antigen/teichoic acid export membrane protein